MKISLDDNKHDEDITKLNQIKLKTYKDLTFKEKCGYIFDYHKWKILTAIIVIILGIVIIPQVIDNLKPNYLYVSFINCDWKDTEGEDLMNEYSIDRNIDDNKFRLTADTSTIIIRNDNNNYSMESSQKMVALLAGSKIDAIISDKDNHDAYFTNGVYADLRDYMDDTFMKKYSDHLYYSTDPETNEQIPTGIYVQDCSNLKGAYPSVESIFGIIINTKNKEHAVDFLKYLLGE